MGSVDADPGTVPVRLVEDKLVLREWTDGDLPVMVELFDSPEIDRWTPLESPFHLDAAVRYLARARSARQEGKALQLAITEDGHLVVGEVVIAWKAPQSVEFGYAVGRQHTGRGLARRAVTAALHYCEGLGYREAVLLIDRANEPSLRVARATGFTRAPDLDVERHRKGRTVQLNAWRRQLQPTEGAGLSCRLGR